ncbi:MAG: NifB/NifX family molybdenum-iron cluster-binding protein [Kiritimatiellae bacterium]|nr:NifB/NifX family molybdenum-iron cluster-binding protein [Kiritimatiellia bacterium]
MNAIIAIPYFEGNVFEHFGKSEQFKIYTIENDQVVASEVAATDGTGHDAIGLWLIMRGVNAVICGNIGPAALGGLAAAGIMALAGVDVSCDEAIAKFIKGELVPAEAANCSCHSHSSCGGSCGSGCGGCHGRCH